MPSNEETWKEKLIAEIRAADAAGHHDKAEALEAVYCLRLELGED